jgi:hypothetical protein
MVVLIQTFEFQCCVFVSLHVMIAWTIYPPPPFQINYISKSDTVPKRTVSCELRCT